MSALSELSGSLVRHPRGAWGNRTHSYTGRLWVGRERIAFYATRNFDRDAKTGERVSWDVALNRPGSNRELRGKKWETARIAVKSEFRAAIEKALADDDAAARAEMVSREAADEMGFAVEPVTSHPVTIGTQETAPACPPLAVDPAPALAIVTGRSVDGAEYLTAHGFCNDPHAALVMPMADAVEIAAREESKAAATRSPDNGVYQIKAVPYRGPTLYTLADYDRDAREMADLDALYADSAGGVS